MASPHRIGSSPLASLRALGVQGQQPVQNYPQLARLVSTRLSPRHALLFAEPVPDAATNRIDWYSAADGAGPRRLTELTPEARATAEAELERFGSDIAALAESFIANKDPDQQLVGKLLQQALTYPSNENVYLVGDQPVITEWGHTSADPTKSPQVLSRSKIALERGRVVRPPESPRGPVDELGGVLPTGGGAAAIAMASGFSWGSFWSRVLLWFALGLLTMTLLLSLVYLGGRAGLWSARYWMILAGGHDPRNAIALRDARAAEAQLRVQLAMLNKQYGLTRGQCAIQQANGPQPGPVVPSPNPLPQPAPQPAPAPQPVPPPSQSPVVPCGGGSVTPNCAPPPRPPTAEPQPPAGQAASNADFDSRLQREHAKTGGLAVSLLWNNVNDLDLGMIEPSGEHINLSHRQSKTGGTLDVDMNATQPSATPVENIYWPDGGVPPGHYKVYVRYLKSNPGPDSGEPTTYYIRVKFPDHAEQASGSLKLGDKPVLAKEFDVPGSPGAKK